MRRHGLIVSFLTFWILSLAAFGLLAAGGRDAIRRYFALLPTAAVYRCAQSLAEADYARTEREARQALGANLYDFEPRSILVESLLRSKRIDDAYRELAEMEWVSRIAKKRASGIHGLDLGWIFYRMAQIDLSQGRTEQATGHFLRIVDEAPDYVDFAPKGETSLREFVHAELKNPDISIENMIVFSRVLYAMDEEPAARLLLDRIHKARPRFLVPLLVEAEIDLHAMAQTYTDEELQARIESARALIDSVLASPGADRAVRLWATLLRGGRFGDETRPVEPIADSALDSLLGDAPVLVLKSRAFASPERAANIGPERVNLFRLGTLRAEFRLEAPARSVWILARGSSAMGLWPYVIVRLDGREVGRLYLRLNAYRPYALPVAAQAGAHVLELEFTNDEMEKMWGTDTNVYLRGAAWMP